MIGILGEYEATLDAKGRFLLPVGFKKQLPEEDTTRFVMNRGMDGQKPCVVAIYHLEGR